MLPVANEGHICIFTHILITGVKKLSLINTVYRFGSNNAIRVHLYMSEIMKHFYCCYPRENYLVMIDSNILSHFPELRFMK